MVSRAEYQRLYRERKKAKSVYVKKQLVSRQKRNDSSKRSKKKQKISEEDRYDHELMLLLHERLANLCILYLLLFAKVKKKCNGDS